MRGRRVVIVDDHAIFRAQARSVLEQSGFDVVGEAGDVRSGIESVHDHSPDIVLLDIQLPDGDGFAAARQMAQGDRSPAVVLISSRDRAVYAAALAETPAVGFIGKAELSGAALEALITGTTAHGEHR